MSDRAVSVGRCTADDIDDVLGFIDAHWKRGHVLTRCRPLLDWQHREPDGGYSFVIARRDGRLVGILGYIATRRFDPALARSSVVWLTTWRVLADAPGGLGLALLQQLVKTEPHAAVGALGLNPATAPIYRALAYRMGELQHYVRPNRTTTRFSLATLAVSAQPADVNNPLTASSLVNEEQFAALDGMFGTIGRTPAKTARYFFGRYARHPVYAYRVVALCDTDSVVGLLAARLAEHDGHRALRIVDVLAPADAIARMGSVVDTLMLQTDAEYADVYNAGIEPDVFARAGFARVDPDGSDIVPDHFEPFERRNVRLWYAFTGEPVLYKGDADQDRPSDVSNALG